MSAATAAGLRRRSPAAVWLRGSGVQWGVTVVVAVLVLAPLIPTLIQAFVDRPLYAEGWRPTFANLVSFFTLPGVRTATVNTLLFAAMSTVLAQVIGAAAAFLAGRTDLPGHAWLGELVAMPLYLSHLVIALGWLMMYGPSGFVTQLVGSDEPWWDLYSLPGMALVAGVCQAPVAYIYCYYGATRAMDPALEDAARMAGAGRWRVVRAITVPLLAPSLVSSAILNFVAAVEMLAIPRELGRTARINTLATYLYEQGIDSTRPNYGLIASSAVVLIVLVGLSIAFQARFLRGAHRYRTVEGKGARLKRIRLGAFRWPAFALMAGYVLICVLVPLAGVVLRSATTFLTPLVPLWDMATTDNFTLIVQQPLYRSSMLNTIVVGAVTAALGTALCAAIVLVVQRSPFRFAGLLDGLALLPRVVPGLIVGLGVFYAAAIFPPMGWLRGTVWILVVAYMMILIPVGLGMVGPAGLQLGRDLDRAARSTGSDWLSAAWRIMVPLLRPALAGCFILLFTASLRAYAAAMFLFSPDTQVIGSTMLNLMDKGETGVAAALAVVQLAMTFLLVVVARRALGVRLHD